jgi:hypothetical protein
MSNILAIASLVRNLLYRIVRNFNLKNNIKYKVKNKMENENLNETEVSNNIIDTINNTINNTIQMPASYWATSHLRYAKKEIMIDEQSSKYELMLQQMWQGSDGTQKWEWVEVVE